MIQIIAGPPGTGKTTTLIDIMEKEMENGVEPEEIAFVSFTKKATQEAMQRVIDTFRLAPKDFPWIRTFHSIAYQVRGCHRDQVMASNHYDEIGKMLGIEFSRDTMSDIMEGALSTRHKGDYYNYMYNFARARGLTFETVWDMLRDEDTLDWFEFKRYVNTVTEYKNDNGLIDFCDMLFVHDTAIPVKVAIIDEAQDLSTAQWKLAASLFRTAERMYIAGDDDQAIYTWAGADVKHFLNMEGERRVLSQSHRIPRKIHTLAMEIAERINMRMPKVYHPKAEQGSVDFYHRADDVDFSSGSWLLLARNGYMLSALARVCRDQGVYFSFRGGSSVNKQHLKAIMIWEAHRKGTPITTEEMLFADQFMPRNCHDIWSSNKIWHEVLTGIPEYDRDYYISLLRRGEKITKEPRVHISTIHGVKGGEADNVALVTDISLKTHYTKERFPDHEHRVWYVGATRAAKSLHIILPKTKFSYNI
jgi:DNA helicase-2/ATP-dependent DNA helicase PcrA